MYESLCMHASHFRLQQLNKSTVRKEKHGGISSQAWCKQSNRWYQESKNDNGIKTYWCVQFSESVSICGALTMSLTSLIFPLLPHTSSSFLSSFLFLLWQIKFTQAVHHSPSPHAIHFFSFFFITCRYGNLPSLHKVNTGTPPSVGKLSKRAWNWFITGGSLRGDGVMNFMSRNTQMQSDWELVLNSQR